MQAGAVIFDLDGTLTVPRLDFQAIRDEIGLGPGPILESLESLDDGARRQAEVILNRHEREAAECAELHEGAVEVLAALRAGGCPVAVLTRNARPWASLVLQRFGIEVDALRTREDGANKPSAQPVLALCAQLGAVPARSWVVGDYLFDIQAGRSAGTQTVLMVGNGPIPPYAAEADHVVRRLGEVLPLVLRG